MTAIIIKVFVLRLKLLPADLILDNNPVDSVFKGGNELKFINLAIIYILKEIKIVFKRIQYKDNLIIYKMLFRTGEGKLIQIKKYDFINDKLYYQKIIEVKNTVPKLEKTFNNKYNKNSNKKCENVTTNNIDA